MINIDKELLQKYALGRTGANRQSEQLINAKYDIAHITDINRLDGLSAIHKVTWLRLALSSSEKQEISVDNFCHLLHENYGESKKNGSPDKVTPTRYREFITGETKNGNPITSEHIFAKALEKYFKDEFDGKVTAEWLTETQKKEVETPEIEGEVPQGKTSDQPSKPPKLVADGIGLPHEKGPVFHN